MNYGTKDGILAIFGIVGFVSLVTASFAAFASIWDGGLFAPFTTWVFLLLACGSALVMHGAARLRVNLWTERIKKS